MVTTRPDAQPMATVDPSTADVPGRYVGGNHSILCEPQVIHAPSSPSPTPLRSTGDETESSIGVVGSTDVIDVAVVCTDEDDEDEDGKLCSLKVPMSVQREEPATSNFIQEIYLSTSSVAVQRPFAASQSLMVQSYDADTSWRLSRENATVLLTEPLSMAP
jgi:hypothetical protein